MIFLGVIGIFAYFILPLVLYLGWIEKVNYRFMNIRLEPSYSWFIFIVETALLVQIIYWVKP